MAYSTCHRRMVMNNKEAYEIGKDKGMEILMYGEFRDGITYEELMDAVLETEEHARQFSPFEFLAHEINCESDYPDEIWESYEEGIIEAVELFWNSCDYRC
jgi:hypothetical protein